MKFLTYTFLGLALMFTVGAVGHAQEETTTSADTDTTAEVETTEEAVDDETTVADESEIDEDLVEEIEEAEEGGITEEEAMEILDEADIEVLESIEDVTDIEGEVVFVTDDVVIIETEDGETVVVQAEAYNNFVYGGGSLRNIVRVGTKVDSGTVDTTGEEPVVVVNGTTYTISSDVPVVKGGESITLAELEEGDEVAVVFNAEGEVIGLEVIDAINGAMSAILWVIIILVVIILLSAMSRKKNPAQAAAPASTGGEDASDE